MIFPWEEKGLWWMDTTVYIHLGRLLIELRGMEGIGDSAPSSSSVVLSLVEI